MSCNKATVHAETVKHLLLLVLLHQQDCKQSCFLKESNDRFTAEKKNRRHNRSLVISNREMSPSAPVYMSCLTFQVCLFCSPHQNEREREREVSWGKNTTPMIHRLQSSMAETELFSCWFGKAQPHCLFNQKSFSGYKQHNMNFSKSSLLCPKVNIFLVVAYVRHMTLLLVSRMFHIRTEVVITAL